MDALLCCNRTAAADVAETHDAWLNGQGWRCFHVKRGPGAGKARRPHLAQAITLEAGAMRLLVDQSGSGDTHCPKCRMGSRGRLEPSRLIAGPDQTSLRYAAAHG